jgi:hypothetical protein
MHCNSNGSDRQKAYKLGMVEIVNSLKPVYSKISIRRACL